MPNGAAMVVRASYPLFEGMITNGPYLRIGLCVGAGGRLHQQIGAARLEGLWRSGTLAITPPHRSGTVRCEAMTIIGLALAPGAVLAGRFDPDHLDALARSFHDDALLVSVMTALYHEADLHGASTAFFEHGSALVMGRLMELRERPIARRTASPLPQARYDRVVAYVESRLGDDMSVIDLAAVAGMDPSGFTRALRARIGLAPYAWLTHRRMQRAALLLAQGLSVTQVANSVGYSNISKFAVAFRRVLNCSPSQWPR